MTDQEYGTLSYGTSPKTSKRTSFQVQPGVMEEAGGSKASSLVSVPPQDELKAAVSARLTRTEMDQSPHSDHFSEADDDFLLFLKSRQKKASSIQPRSNRTHLIDDELFDDAGKYGKMKKVSFLETFSVHSPSEDIKASDSHEYDSGDSSVNHRKTFNHSFSLQNSSDREDEDSTFINDNGASADSKIATLNTSRSSSDLKEDTPLPLPLDDSEIEPPDPEEKNRSALEESCQTPQLLAPDLQDLSLADNVAEKEPPKPKPRQRTFGKRHQTVEKREEDAESQDFSRPQTSSTSIPFYTDTSSDSTWAQEEHMNSRSRLQPRDNFVSDNNNPDSNNSSEEKHYSEGQLDQASPSTISTSTFDTRTSSCHSKTPQKSQRQIYKNVKSKYLGTCKLLDQKISVEGSQEQTAESLRATVYQKWLQDKKEFMKETVQLKKEITEDKRNKEEEERKEAATAAYEAWKKQKAQGFEVKAKEKQDKIRKEQREIKEKEERKQSAKQVYDKWKLEHDQKLKEKFRKKREVEKKCQLQKQENEEDRKRDSKYAFSSWSEKKRNVIHERLTKEHKSMKNKAEEEQYIKEEKDKMAIEAFENWLSRKGVEERRQREEMRIQTILRESPPPPWNPPNKTIPFGK